MTIDQTVTRPAPLAERLIRQRPGNPLALIVGLIALVLMTLTASFGLSSFHLFVYCTCLLACVGAISLNLLMGTAGLVSLGNAAFLAVGGFTTVFVMRLAEVPFPLDALVAGVVAALFGFIVGLPAVRLKGMMLALTSLTAFFVMIYVGNQYQKSVPGAESAGFIFTPMFADRGLEGRQQAWVVLLTVIVALVLIVAWRLMNGKTGRAWRLAREHESVAAAVGIPVTMYKLEAFMISGFLIGVQGSLLAHFSGSVSVESYTLTLSIAYLAMIFVGGLDSLLGAVIGAFLVTSLPQLVPQVTALVFGQSMGGAQGPQVAQIIYGLLIILFVALSPNGIAGWIKDGKWSPFGLVRKRYASRVSMIASLDESAPAGRTGPGSKE